MRGNVLFWDLQEKKDKGIYSLIVDSYPSYHSRFILYLISSSHRISELSFLAPCQDFNPCVPEGGKNLDRHLSHKAFSPHSGFLAFKYRQHAAPRSYLFSLPLKFLRPPHRLEKENCSQIFKQSTTPIADIFELFIKLLRRQKRQNAGVGRSQTPFFDRLNTLPQKLLQINTSTRDIELHDRISSFGILWTCKFKYRSTTFGSNHTPS